MDTFVVSARKYRPATFDTVVGQPSITSTLKNAIRSNQLAQAFLFCGPRGVGKTTCARILAKTINCLNITENVEPCNECESCKNFNTSASFNIYELDAASNNSVDDIRSLVEQVRIPPQTGKYKVYIIDEVHMLSAQAFNAFLKTLEEPPTYAKFILATTEKHKIIPTIISRCQIFDFKRITIESIINHLKYVAASQSVTVDDNSLLIIAQKSDGSMRDSLSIFDQIVSFSGKNIVYQNVIDNLNVLDIEHYFKLTEALIKGNIAAAILIVDDIIDRGFDGQHFMGGLGSHFRNLLMCKDSSTIKLLEVGEIIQKRYQEQSSKSSDAFLIKALELNNQFDFNYKNSNNKRLHLEILVIQLCAINQTQKSELVAKKKPVIEEAAPLKVEVAKGVVIPKTPLTKGNTTQLGRGSISIKDLTSGIKETLQESEPEYKNLPGKAFTEENLQTAWSEYVAANTEESGNYYITISKRKPILKGDFTVSLDLDNKIQEDDILSRKRAILDFLHNRLENYQIDLELNVIQNSQESKAYTPVDKFKKMAASNQSLVKLKDEFDLELEF